MWILLGLMIWIVLGFIGAGFLFAYRQGEHPKTAERDKKFDLTMSICIGGLFGPASFIISIMDDDLRKHGWRLW